MSDLLINDVTRAELDNFLRQPGHALLLSGPDGSGRLALAKWLAAELLPEKRLEAGSRFNLIQPDDKNTISIDQIRGLKQFTKLKSQTRRVAVVADADKMSAAAQDSFLKLLEEPPEDTVFVLSAVSGGLKPTILSRAQLVRVRPITLASAKRYFQADDAAIERAYQIAGGKLGLMSRLIVSGEQTLILAAEDAKLILSSNHYQRLCLVDELSKDRNRSTAILAVLGEIAETALRRADNDRLLARWQKVLLASYQAEKAIRSRVNAKLVLTDFMLNV